MPTISRFHGIIIRMYFKDHGVPHFHVQYGECWAVYSILSLRRLEGGLPTVQQKLVEAWAALYRDRLEENARLLSRDLAPRKIPGLR
jgi:hypothetical protein